MSYKKLDDFQLKEECGVFAIAGVDNAVWVAYNALHSLRHRGQDSAGIAWNNNNKIIVKKDNGLLNHVFNGYDFDNNKADKAIGHVRYATTGDQNIANIHPFVYMHSKRNFALAHNGNLSNTPELRLWLENQGAVFFGTSDTEIVGHLLIREKGSFEEALKKVLRKLEGAFSMVFNTPDAVYATRDKLGFRPLALGKLGKNYVIASESVAFDAIGAQFVRDVKPGEIIKITKGKCESFSFEKTTEVQLDAMELIYFARPDSVIDGIQVHEFRSATGRTLAKEHPSPQADIVVPVPDSSLSAAQGYGREAGLPIELAIVKNRYVARTFIQATQSHREIDVRRKLNVSSMVKGKNVVLVDDSIVRGTTIKKIIDMLRTKGAKRIDVRIASPMVIAPSYYGINISTYSELMATTHKTPKEISKYIGADSVQFISVDGIRKNAPKLNLDMCIFENKYRTFISPKLLKEARK